MNRQSPFAEEWRACLREHYKTTVRDNDRATLATLTGVMHEAGFRDDELRQLMIEATMRVEDAPQGFTPPLDLLEQPLTNRHPAECQCPECVAANLVPHDAEGQPLAGEALQDEAARAQWEAARDGEGDSPDESSITTEDPDGFKQLSMFD